MRPKAPDDLPSPDLFRNRLENMLDQRHEINRLADLIDWNSFDAEFGTLYCPDNGCPATVQGKSVAFLTDSRLLNR